MYLYISTEICAFIVGTLFAVATVWLISRGKRWFGSGWIIIETIGICCAMALLVGLMAA